MARRWVKSMAGNLILDHRYCSPELWQLWCEEQRERNRERYAEASRKRQLVWLAKPIEERAAIWARRRFDIPCIDPEADIDRPGEKEWR